MKHQPRMLASKIIRIFGFIGPSLILLSGIIQMTRIDLTSTNYVGYATLVACSLEIAGLVVFVYFYRRFHARPNALSNLAKLSCIAASPIRRKKLRQIYQEIGREMAELPQRPLLVWQQQCVEVVDANSVDKFFPVIEYRKFSRVRFSPYATQIGVSGLLRFQIGRAKVAQTLYTFNRFGDPQIHQKNHEKEVLQLFRHPLPSIS